jgi:hypothetical protein
MLARTADTESFWEAFRCHARLDHDNYAIGSFGDSPEMATELADFGRRWGQEGYGELGTGLR